MELEEFMDAVLADLTDEGKVLNLLLYLWLESGVEFLESVEVLDSELDRCLLHPAGEELTSTFPSLATVGAGGDMAGDLYQEETFNLSILACTLL